MTSIDDYQFCSQLAVGNFGTVYESKRLGIKRETVAIKQIRIEMKSAYIRSACREIRILSTASHPNVLNLHTAFRDGEFLFIVTDIFDHDLARIIDSDELFEKIKSRDILFIFYQLLSGLNYLHEAGICHRDIKPSNVLVNNDYSIKIGDFGSARSIPSRKTRCDLTDYVVTRFYRAPEAVCATGEYGPLLDVWALGCVMAELLTRNILFPGK